jgi:hypothetical protein
MKQSNAKSARLINLRGMTKYYQRGGARAGAGRPTAKDTGIEKKRSYTVSIKPTDKAKICKKYGSLSKAIETLINETIAKKSNRRKI